MTDVAHKSELTLLFDRPPESAPHDLFSLIDDEMPRETACRLVHDEAMLDGNARRLLCRLRAAVEARVIFNVRLSLRDGRRDRASEHTAVHLLRRNEALVENSQGTRGSLRYG